MGKDPAFLFYPNDYLGGTMGFSIEQHGLYIIALIFQFNHGKFSEPQINSLLNGKFDSIKHKFQTDGKLFWNERLNTEKEKRKLYTESRKRNGRSFLLKKDKPLINTEINTEHMGIPPLPHMENENRDRIKDVIKDKIELIIPAHLTEIWPDFLSMRRTIRKPATDRAQRNIVTELEKLAPGDHTQQVKILEQSITNSWQGVFALKNNNVTTGHPYERI